MLVAFLATLIVGALLYKFIKSDSKSFWEQQGIRYIDTSPAIGKMGLLLGKMTQAVNYAYNQMGSDKCCVIMELFTPVLLVKDMELIKKVLIKDFDYFADRRHYIQAEDRSLSKMLSVSVSTEWKGVRGQLSSTFTASKIKGMMDCFNSVSDEWCSEYTRKANETPGGSLSIDVSQSVNQYTVEVISTTAFGMNAGVIKDPNSTFMKMVTRVTDFNKRLVFRFALRFGFPKLSKLLRLSPFDMEALGFFERILSQNLQSRLRGETKRNDFMQLLVEARKGELKTTDVEDLGSFERDAHLSPTKGVPKRQYLTEEVMNGQLIQFFFAGFLTASNFITFALYTLATHQDIQERLRQEVDKIVKEDGTLDYDDIGSLVYLDMVTNEVFRKFPPLAKLERVCVKDYKDPESGLSIPKGTVVGIPLCAIHRDKRYYGNPDNFDPEHFAPERKAARNPYAFMPFGSGPRNCIGMRFAMIEVKSAIAHILHSFVIEPTAKTPLPVLGRSAGFQVIPPKDLELKLTPINGKTNFIASFVR